VGRTPQNVYDDPEFFKGYLALRRDDAGLNELEQPALRACLPKLHGLSVLDLGCGFGDFAAWCISEGARSVIAVDLSARMLEERVKAEGVSYVRSSVEEVQFAPSNFDVVVSSLAFHYVADFDAVVRSVATWLRPGGYFAFSVEHPLQTAAMPKDDIRCPDSHAASPYADEGPRLQEWFVPGVRKYHRTLASYLEAIAVAGLQLTGVSEPTPTPEFLGRRPRFADLAGRPPFLVVASRRPLPGS